MKRFLRLSAFVLAVAVLASGCSFGGGENSSAAPSDVQPDSDTSTDVNVNINKDDKLPLFNNTVSYERGGVTVEKEDYQDYEAYRAKTHTFSDMLFDEAELAAIRTAEAGVFELTDTFNPAGTVTVAEYIRGILLMAGKVKPGAAAADVEAAMNKLGLIGSGVTMDMNAVITREQMAYLLDRACEDAPNAEQYKLALTDFNQINETFRTGVLQIIALGIWKVESTFAPTRQVTRAEAALTLYRLSKAGMRLIPAYDIGDAYEDGVNAYLVKTTLDKNEGGIQLGTYSEYNHQADSFTTFGKLPVDRVDFHKWCDQETSPGVYSFPQFGNELNAHTYGNTVITSVEVAANLLWNPSFHKDMIPSFYKCDITDPETRKAAKAYLYAFVQALMGAVKGDVWLSLDYEVDWEMNISGDGVDSRLRAKVWGEWYCEAAKVMREAAKQAGAGDRLKLIIIYNNVTDQHKLGKDMNEWMVNCAKASDYIGLDDYWYSELEDVTDFSDRVMQDVRFLINNYSDGKPVMIIENGMSFGDSKEGLDKQALYYDHLFRSFYFGMDDGNFLNRNFNAYLFWSLTRTEGNGNGVVWPDGRLTPAAETIIKWYHRIRNTRQYNCSKTAAIQNVANVEEAYVSVDSGTDYEKLTLVTKSTKGAHTLRIKIKDRASVMITVNGEYNYVGKGSVDRHYIDIPTGIVDGVNVIDIYFGNPQTPFKTTIEAINLK